MIRYGQTTRTSKILSVGRRKVELVVHIPRLFCKNCGSTRQAHIDFADSKKHYTRSLERFVIDLCRIMTIADAAQLTGLSWDTVKEIYKSYLKDKYQSVSLAAVRYIAGTKWSTAIYLNMKRLEEYKQNHMQEVMTEVAGYAMSYMLEFLGIHII